MKYRKDKYGNEISVLGYGCMRFSKTAGAIDMDVGLFICNKANGAYFGAYKDRFDLC